MTNPTAPVTHAELRAALEAGIGTRRYMSDLVSAGVCAAFEDAIATLDAPAQETAARCEGFECAGWWNENVQVRGHHPKGEPCECLCLHCGRPFDACEASRAGGVAQDDCGGAEGRTAVSGESRSTLESAREGSAAIAPSVTQSPHREDAAGIKPGPQSLSPTAPSAPGLPALPRIAHFTYEDHGNGAVTEFDSIFFHDAVPPGEYWVTTMDAAEQYVAACKRERQARVEAEAENMALFEGNARACEALTAQHNEILKLARIELSAALQERDALANSAVAAEAECVRLKKALADSLKCTPQEARGAFPYLRDRIAQLESDLAAARAEIAKREGAEPVANERRRIGPCEKCGADHLPNDISCFECGACPRCGHVSHEWTRCCERGCGCPIPKVRSFAPPSGPPASISKAEYDSMVVIHERELSDARAERDAAEQAVEAAKREGVREGVSRALEACMVLVDAKGMTAEHCENAIRALAQEVKG